MAYRKSAPRGGNARRRVLRFVTLVLENGRRGEIEVRQIGRVCDEVVGLEGDDLSKGYDVALGPAHQ